MFGRTSSVVTRSAFRRSPITIQSRQAGVITSVRYLQSLANDEAVLARYKKKLEEKAKLVGAKDIGDLKEKLKDEIETKKKELGKVNALEELDQYLGKNESSKNPNIIKISKPLTPKPKDDAPPFKTLKSFIDVEKISQLEPEQIGLIWRARFQSKPQYICSVIPEEVFEKLYKTARKSQNFILPLKKEGAGHELHFVQWNFSGPQTTHVIFTTLAEYKLHGEFSKPHTTLTFHQELKKDKGIILMSGIIESEGNVSLSDAQLLILNLQNFYGALKDDPKKQELLEAFNKGTDDFSLDALIAESKDVGN